MAKASGKFRFRKHDNIGANDAEDDSRFLSACFADTGDVDTLLDCSHPARIVLGRTGAGKTALALELQRRSENVISVNPEHLSLNYIANSTIIQYLSSLNINLDPFFKLLWRHVFAVTIIQDRFDVVDEDRQKGLFTQLLEHFESKESRTRKQRQSERRKKALDYLQRWGDKFFQDVEHRTKEVTTRFEREVSKALQNSFGIDIMAGLSEASAGVRAGAKRASSSKEAVGVEETQEVINRAETVIHEIQVQELGGIIELVDEILDDPQKPCYVVIDRLDEQWAEESIRYRLLKGLIDAVREFGRLRHGKIIVCLRIDLLEQLFRETRSEAGFQEDKYRSLYLPIRWTHAQLIDLLDRRIGELVRDQYTEYVPKLIDIVPERLNIGRRGREKTSDFILDRTWSRPRDIIEFLNACIRRAEGKASLTKDIIFDAEGEYSRGRLRAIAQEWHRDYSHLPECAKTFLTNRSNAFRLGEIEEEVMAEWALAVVCDEKTQGGRVWELANDFTRATDQQEAAKKLRRGIGSVLYRTGIIGLRIQSGSSVRWADNESYSVSPAELDDNTHVHVHPGLWRVLGIDPF
jgi:hypothetical protein